MFKLNFVHLIVSSITMQSQHDILIGVRNNIFSIEKIIHSIDNLFIMTTIQIL